MKHQSHDEQCGICRANTATDPIFENDLWLVRRMPPGIGVPGWMMVNTQRHVPGIAAFDDEEAANFGPAFRHLCSTLKEVTGALRIYTAAMGESFPHFHAHLVPRSAEMPNDASAWGVFDLYRATQQQEVAIDPDEATRIAVAYGEALQQNSPPR
jgi:diadenosine tetraphosphate (Ap4A) HIT family hydrolase